MSISHSQVYILMLSFAAEAVLDSSISPLLPFIVAFLEKNSENIGAKVGILQSAFFSSLLITNTLWGILSDRYGRKTFLLVGLVFLVINSIMLGLATSFNLALTCRLIAGIFGANSTIVKGRLGEIQNSLNRAYGFTVYGVMHSLPYMIGNFLGAIFMRISKIVSIDSAIIQQGFPFLPLCLVSSFFATISLIIVYYFLIEPPKIQEFVVLNQEDEDELIHDTQESIELNDSIPDIQVPLQPKATEQVETIFNRKTTTSIFLYCIIACVNIMYMTLLPLYFAAPIEKGGLGYTPSSTSFYFILLSASKLAVNLSPIYKLIAKYGSNYCYTILITLYIPTISLIPIIGSLLSSPPLLLISFTIVMILLGVCESGTYMCVNIMISESVSRNRLGTVHGISSSASAIVRTLFPSISGVLFDLFSFKGGVFGVVVGVSFLGAVVSVL